MLWIQLIHDAAQVDPITAMHALDVFLRVVEKIEVTWTLKIELVRCGRLVSLQFAHDAFLNVPFVRKPPRRDILDLNGKHFEAVVPLGDIQIDFEVKKVIVERAGDIFVHLRSVLVLFGRPKRRLKVPGRGHFCVDDSVGVEYEVIYVVVVVWRTNGSHDQRSARHAAVETVATFEIVVVVTTKRNASVLLEHANGVVSFRRRRGVNEGDEVEKRRGVGTVDAFHEFEVRADAPHAVEIVGVGLHGRVAAVERGHLLKAQLVHNSLAIESYIEQLRAGGGAYAKIKTPTHVLDVIAVGRVPFPVRFVQSRFA